MRSRHTQRDASTALSGKERGTLQEFLAYIEDRVKDVEPVCADLVRKARLALTEKCGTEEPGRSVH